MADLKLDMSSNDGRRYIYSREGLVSMIEKKKLELMIDHGLLNY